MNSTKSVSSNYIKSSDLIFISVGIGVIKLLFLPKIFSGFEIFVASLTFLIIIGIGMLIRNGVEWIKYLLFILIGFGFFLNYSMVIDELKYNPIIGILSIIQSFLQIWATVLLFIKDDSKPKE